VDGSDRSGASLVLVVDDDPSMRESLQSLFDSAGLPVRTFGSTMELMQNPLPAATSCLVLDIRLPGESGLDFQANLVSLGTHIPIIFMTGHGDIPMSVQAMKAGAVDFLPKPFRAEEMLDAVRRALAANRARRAAADAVAEVADRYSTLTPREREIVGLVTSGLRNKQIARELGLSEITVKVHRFHAMRKMEARSLADLVRMSDALGLRRETPEAG
jgi:FixJ family two-component response regulator